MKYKIGDMIGQYKILRKGDKRGAHVAQCIKCGYIRSSKPQALSVPNPNCIHTYGKAGVKWKNHRLKVIFNRMKDRCYNPNFNGYKWYGEKGITICEEWLQDPNKFQEWALSNGYQDGLTIDRIDSSKEYSPDNCRWLTREENTLKAVETREDYKNSLITVNGITDNMANWSRRMGHARSYLEKIKARYGYDVMIEKVKTFCES